MPDRQTVFPRAEFLRRTEALQARMAVAGTDALLLTSPADVYYVTGFLTRFWESPARPWFVIVPATGPPVAVIPAIGGHLMGQTWIEDIRTWDAPDPVDDGVTLLAGALAEVVPDHGAIGVPIGLETSLRMPLADFREVERRLAPRRVVDATATLQRVREVKSEAEVALIRDTCAVAGRAFDRVPGIVREGATLDAIFRGFQAALLEEGADWVSYVAGGAGPGGYGDVISPAGSYPLQTGDILMLDTGAVRSGYFCDFDRNYAIGAVDDATRRAHEMLWDVTEHVMGVLQPGMTAREAHGVMIERIVGAGYPPPGGRLGHGLGLTLTEWPSLSSRDETPLVDGMVLTMEPSVEISPGRMLVHEENVVLRGDGAELLSPRGPREMPVVAI